MFYNPNLSSYLNYEEVLTETQIETLTNFYMKFDRSDYEGRLKVSEISKKFWDKLNDRQKKAIGNLFKDLLKNNEFDNIVQLESKSPTNVYYKKKR